jgi:hypothetical protein
MATEKGPDRSKATGNPGEGGHILVIDDWAMAPLSEPERRDFLGDL